MLRSLLPRSLRARLLLFTLGTILLVQAATFATVSHYRKKFTEEVAVDFTATTIRTLRASLAEIPSDERADFVRTASQNQWRLWSRDRKSVVSGKSVSVRVDLGGCRSIKKTKSCIFSNYLH